jgi:transposase
VSTLRKLNTYTKEFKLEAIKLAGKNGSIIQTAKDLGVSDKSLYKWVNEAKEDYAFRGRGNRTPEAEELRQLRLENKRLKETNEILKKAAKYFASESK